MTAVRVLSEKRWVKAEGEYVDAWYGEFDLPNGGIRRCGHMHRHPDAARRCVQGLANGVYRDHWKIV